MNSKSWIRLFCKMCVFNTRSRNNNNYKCCKVMDGMRAGFPEEWIRCRFEEFTSQVRYIALLTSTRFDPFVYRMWWKSRSMRPSISTAMYAWSARRWTINASQSGLARTHTKSLANSNEQRSHVLAHSIYPFPVQSLLRNCVLFSIVVNFFFWLGERGENRWSGCKETYSKTTGR